VNTRQTDREVEHADNLDEKKRAPLDLSHAREDTLVEKVANSEIGKRVLLRPSRFAELADMSRSTVYSLVAKGKLRAVYYGSTLRIPASELQSPASELQRLERVEVEEVTT
jgi:excisionase family DNA binding protein